MLLFVLLSAAPSSPSPPPISDAAIVAYAKANFDKRAMMSRHVVLGIHDGMTVVADHPCSDLCPGYTVRIVHYDAPPGPTCEKAGGLTRSRVVPVSVAVTRRDYCVPAVLGDLP